MAENFDQQVSRLRQMVIDDGGTWDLSPNDKAAIQAVLAALESAPQWQPIETAPKDGTDFLAAWDDDELHVVCISDGICRRAMDPEAWTWMMPSHWMPLPAPPAKGE